MRRQPALGQPPAVLTGYPEHRLRKGTRLWRAHSLGRGPWWFAAVEPGDADAADLGGRFDLVSPRGTCYLATDISTAVRERLGPKLAGLAAMTEKDAATMCVSELRSTGARLADSTAPAAAGFHTRELATSVDYAQTRRWAAAFDAAGFGGVRYESRFTTDARANAVGLFGSAGADDQLDAGEQISGATAAAAAGIAVRTPHSHSMHIVLPPR